MIISVAKTEYQELYNLQKLCIFYCVRIFGEGGFEGSNQSPKNELKCFNHAVFRFFISIRFPQQDENWPIFSRKYLRLLHKMNFLFFGKCKFLPVSILTQHFLQGTLGESSDVEGCLSILCNRIRLAILAIFCSAFWGIGRG